MCGGGGEIPIKFNQIRRQNLVYASVLPLQGRSDAATDMGVSEKGCLENHLIRLCIFATSKVVISLL